MQMYHHAPESTVASAEKNKSFANRRKPAKLRCKADRAITVGKLSHLSALTEPGHWAFNHKAGNVVHKVS
jgi:hypothetical protein